ncbi:MAG: Holliday junction branch migration protein RuvA [Candidatus Fimenecus sp.]
MFYSLKGIPIETGKNFVALDCRGVTFLCKTSLSTIIEVNNFINKEITLFTYLSVSENALDLYGFYTKQECDFFKMLITVKGVGPSSAANILSEFTPEKLALIISTDDSKSLSKAKGVGKKTAQQIILDLKDKVTKKNFTYGDSVVATLTNYDYISSSIEEAIQALISLGYDRSAASTAVGSFDGDLSTEEYIKKALKVLAGIK